MLGLDGGETALRLLGVGFVVIGTLAVWALGRSVWGPTEGLLAAAIVVSAPPIQRRGAERERLLSADDRFLLLFEHGKRQPEGELLQRYMELVEPLPEAVVPDPTGVAAMPGCIGSDHERWANGDARPFDTGEACRRLGGRSGTIVRATARGAVRSHGSW